MLEKLQSKIEKEMDKVLIRDDLKLEDIKTLIDIKNSLEMKSFLKESMSLNNIPFNPADLEETKGEIE